MSNPSRDLILASSKGWIASFLNFLPGLGSGYLYQRRWKPWFATGIFLQGEKEFSQRDQLIGIAVLFLISLVTVIEANFAYKKARSKVIIEEKKNSKKGWFQ